MAEGKLLAKEHWIDYRLESFRASKDGIEKLKAALGIQEEENVPGHPVGAE